MSQTVNVYQRVERKQQFYHDFFLESAGLFFRGRFVSSENPHFRPAQRWGHSATRSSQQWGKGSRNRAQCCATICCLMVGNGTMKQPLFSSFL